MNTETIEILEKTKIKQEAKNNSEPSACCGGAPVSNEDACCKLDEDKKADGQSGCGCNSTTTKTSTTACC